MANPCLLRSTFLSPELYCSLTLAGGHLEDMLSPSNRTPEECNKPEAVQGLRPE